MRACAYGIGGRLEKTPQLAEKLEQKATSLVGTLNKIRREVPVQVKKAKEPLHSTVALKSNNMTLIIYQGKKNKHVLILSTMHPDFLIGTDSKKKPETIRFYNDTKYGVDVVDQMARKYSVKASSRRWPVHTFYNILDVCGINAWILYKECTATKISRRDFILKLAEELTANYRLSRPGPSLQFGRPVAAVESKRHRCQVRKNCKTDGKSQYTCAKCGKPVCKQCVKKTFYVCSLCEEP